MKLELHALCLHTSRQYFLRDTEVLCRVERTEQINGSDIENLGDSGSISASASLWGLQLIADIPYEFIKITPTWIGRCGLLRFRGVDIVAVACRFSFRFRTWDCFENVLG
jgi:hypothetical protein